ncbi:MFS transporter [Paraburkholderia sediminicola]|uniref:MFS transporter n=1 Tax=Paraburkholderia sediminicola TaxID=458836 RepID=UPI0038B8ADEF
MASSLIDVVEVIERQKVGAGQCLVVLLCALLMFLDGFDTQAISYIVPALSRDWHLSREILGSIFSAALVGLMVGSTFLLEDQGEARASVAALVRGRTSAGTVLLWLIFFLNLAEFYFMQSWLPTMLTGLQYSPAKIVWVTALPTIAGVLSAVPLGLAMDRVGPYVTLSVLYLAGCVFMWLVGSAFSGSVAWLMVMVFCAGFCISGGQKSVIAFAAVHYPLNLRSTGVGWALGIGRLGGIAGPPIAGMLYCAHWTPADIFRFSAWPVLVAGIGVFVMGRIYGSRPVVVETSATH